MYGLLLIVQFSNLHSQIITRILNISSSNSLYQRTIKSEEAVRADTIEEACKFFEIDYNAFSETLEQYNGFAKAGKDADFNRRGGLREYSTEVGLFYFIKAAPAVHHTMGGVEINENAEVLDITNKVIPKLFAAGEVTGGIHGSNRLGGNAITDIVVFGKIAGKNVSK